MANVKSFKINDIDSSINLASETENGLMSSDSYNKIENLIQNNLSLADLDIADENNNILARFSNGNFRTKNFDSTKTVTSAQLDEKANKIDTITIEDSSNELTIEDESGNIEVYFSKGHIYTKNFNSKEIITTIEELSSTDSSSNLDSVINIKNITDTPLEEIRMDPGFTPIIKSWGFIGDSLCSGELAYYNENTSSTSYIDMYEYSWGQRMCKLCGTEGYNFSSGGQSAVNWINGNSSRTWDEAGSNNGAKTNLKDCYIIALGVNDTSNSKISTLYSDGVGDVSTDIDFTDYANNNENSIIGCYAGIIQRVRSVQPRSIIFVVTLPTPNTYGILLNEFIRQIPDLFDNTFVLDINQYGPNYNNSTFNSRYLYGGHLTVTGYQWSAYMFCTYIDWIIRNNWDTFKYVGFIGTDYYIK